MSKMDLSNTLQKPGPKSRDLSRIILDVFNDNRDSDDSDVTEKSEKKNAQ